MTDKKTPPASLARPAFLAAALALAVLTLLAGCDASSPAPAELEAVDYRPLPGDDWQRSTPAEQGLDPMLVAELYHDAAELETLYGLLVVKNGYLVAEDYFHEGSVGRKTLLQSAAKSITSALAGTQDAGSWAAARACSGSSTA